MSKLKNTLLNIFLTFLFCVLFLLLPLGMIILHSIDITKMNYYDTTQGNLVDVKYNSANPGTEYFIYSTYYTGKYIFHLNGTSNYIENDSYFYPPEIITIYYNPQTLDDFFVGNITTKIIIISISIIWLFVLSTVLAKWLKRKNKARLKTTRSEMIQDKAIANLITQEIQAKLKSDIIITYDYKLTKNNSLAKTKLTLDLSSLEDVYTSKGIEEIKQELKSKQNYINKIRLYAQNNDCDKIKVNFYLSEKSKNIYTFLEIYYEKIR